MKNSLSDLEKFASKVIEIGNYNRSICCSCNNDCCDVYCGCDNDCGCHDCSTQGCRNND
jgi:hypothetical protein